MSLETSLAASYSLEADADDRLSQYPGINPTNITYTHDAAIGRNVANFDGTSHFSISGDLFTSVNTSYTLSMWVKSSGWTGPDQALMTDHDNDSTQPNSTDSLLFWVEGTYPQPGNQGRLTVQHRGPDQFGSGHPRATVVAPSAVAENSWEHLVVTWDGSTTKVYINGTLDLEASNSQAPWDSTTEVRVGHHRGLSGFQGFVGSMANVDMWVERTLSAADVTALYNQGIYSRATGTYYPDPVAYYDFEVGSSPGTSHEVSPAGNNLHGVNHNQTSYISSHARGGIGHIHMHGPTHSDVISLGSDTKLKPANAFSISMWVRRAQNIGPLNDNYPNLFGSWHAGGPTEQKSYTLCQGDSGTVNGRLNLFLRDHDLTASAGGETIVSTVDIVLSMATWHHVVATYSGQNKRVRLYVDGVEKSTTVTGNPVPSRINVTSSFQTAMGARYGQTTGDLGYWEGSVDEVTLWDVELASYEVESLYNNFELRWDALNGLTGVRGFAHGDSILSSSGKVCAYLTVNDGVSKIVVTDALTVREQLRELQLSDSVIATSIALVGRDLMAVGFADGTIKIVAIAADAESCSVASTISESALTSTSIYRLWSDKNVAGTSLVIATDSGKVYFAESVVPDGSSHSGLSSMTFDLSAIRGEPATVVDVCSGGGYITIISIADGQRAMHAFNYSTGSQVSLNNLPFLPWDVYYSGHAWFISNVVQGATTTNILDWQ